MHILLDIPLFFVVVFLAASIVSMITVFVLRIIRLRHAADIAELFATAFFMAYAIQNWICYPNATLINIMLSSLAGLVVVYKIIFFIRGK
ncbi:MAG: hypothetical protein IJQ67_05680 [Bacilli bacterium]|nr:hypothetical protein [Bacilli bacterium]